MIFNRADEKPYLSRQKGEGRREKSRALFQHPVKGSGRRPAAEPIAERPSHRITVERAHLHPQPPPLAFHRPVFSLEQRTLLIPAPEYLKAVGDQLAAGEEQRKGSTHEAANGEIEQAGAFRRRVDDAAVRIGIDPELGRSIPACSGRLDWRWRQRLLIHVSTMRERAVDVCTGTPLVLSGVLPSAPSAFELGRVHHSSEQADEKAEGRRQKFLLPSPFYYSFAGSPKYGYVSQRSSSDVRRGSPLARCHDASSARRRASVFG